MTSFQGTNRVKMEAYGRRVAIFGKRAVDANSGLVTWISERLALDAGNGYSSSEATPAELYGKPIALNSTVARPLTDRMSCFPLQIS